MVYSLFILIISLGILVSQRKIISTIQWTEVLFIPKKTKPVKILPLTGLFRSLMLSTTICILAVDFPIFHRKFAKNTEYGISLMDTGVGAFIALNGILSPEARNPLSNDRYLLNKTLFSSAPLVLIGFARMISLRITNYNYNVSEYGVHWNFFVTVAMVKIICCLLNCKLIRRIKINSIGFSLVIMIGYQTALSCGLSTFLLDQESRGNLFSANKEGICSVIGFIPLYLVSVSIGRYLYNKRRTGKSVDLVIMACLGGVICLVSGVASNLCHLFIQEVSRRQTNAAYILWILCLYSLLLSAECILVLMIEFMQSVGLLQQNEPCQPILSTCLDSNSLVIFLLANLLTGAVNLTSNTMEAGIVQSLSILVIYSTTLSLVSFGLKSNKIDVRIRENIFDIIREKVSLLRGRPTIKTK